MDKEKRRKKIVDILSSSTELVSGSVLASTLGVTRQIIVQDIAILKSRGFNIASMARGYILEGGKDLKKLIAVKHTKEQIREELTCIVQNGGEIMDVIVGHPVYGEIRGNLGIKTLDDVEIFMNNLHASNALPLLSLSGGVHLHTISADHKNTLNKIVNALQEKGFLL